ncbi:MAG TPA: riboflavin synthase [Candidatus Polarisedimenticolia bacterium]|nr:riboflavin synthase [Candidatus Polarisedimenticolia bacterium]
MFTGIIEGQGTIGGKSDAGGEIRLRIEAAFLGSVRRGQSLAVDGVCLTAVGDDEGAFEAVVSPETLARTTLGSRRAGDRVNLEPPLRLGDRLGGHLVQGHVDGVGRVVAVTPEGSGRRMRIAFPDALAPAIVTKGSIAVDGVSLTVAARGRDDFEAALIPETLRTTGLGGRAAGDAVNLEVDLVGRYVVEALGHRLAAPPSRVTRELLERHGFTARTVAS